MGCDTLVILPSLSWTGFTRIASKKAAASPCSQLNRDLFLEFGAVLRLYGHPLGSCLAKKSAFPVKLFSCFQTFWLPHFVETRFLSKWLSFTQMRSKNLKELKQEKSFTGFGLFSAKKLYERYFLHIIPARKKKTYSRFNCGHGKAIDSRYPP